MLLLWHVPKGLTMKYHPVKPVKVTVMLEDKGFIASGNCKTIVKHLIVR